MTVIDRQRQQVSVGGRNLTDRVSALTYSAVAQGGFEIASFTVPPADAPAKGAAVVIRQGLEVAWAGRVAEVAEHSAAGRSSVTVGCEGYQALLKDNPYSMVYVDRELGQWHGMGTQRRINIVGENYGITDPSTARDEGGKPSVRTAFAGDWASPVKPISEAWYDAGAGNYIGSLYYAWTRGANISGANWSEIAFLAGTDVGGGSVATGPQLSAEASGAKTLLANGPHRYALLQLLFSETAKGTAGLPYEFYWQPVVYGNHGLSKRGPDAANGFYPSDVARHALSQAKGIAAGVILDSTSYIAPHVVYRGPTPPGTVINDMAKLVGWNWGVWEPPTVLNSEPRFDFRPPPTDATAVIARAECDQLDITQRLGDLYDSALVSYSDPAGTSGAVTVTRANPLLREAGVAGRVLILSAGLAGKAEAESLGSFALALSQLSARGAGQATLPRYVRLPGGGSKPACLLRAGNDRLRINDMTGVGSLTDIGTNRRDVFHIERVETTVGADGVPSTRVDLDQGTNLLETLQARLALAAAVVGSGAASGG